MWKFKSLDIFRRVRTLRVFDIAVVSWKLDSYSCGLTQQWGCSSEFLRFSEILICLFISALRAVIVLGEVFGYGHDWQDTTKRDIAASSKR